MACSSVAAETVQASRIVEFLNTIGINGQIGGNGTPHLNASGIVADAQYVGIRNWRDSLSAQSPPQLESPKALVNASIGLVGIPLENQTITVSDHINRAKVWAALGPHALMAPEGPNEPVYFPDHLQGHEHWSGRQSEYVHARCTVSARLLPSDQKGSGFKHKTIVERVANRSPA